MTVINASKDTDALTITLVADFSAPPERVWQVWEDPRQLERWWGPPTWPATFTKHDLTAGGEARYFMTGPDGTTAHGWWDVVAVEPPHRIEIVDGFAETDGARLDDPAPTPATVTLDAIDTGTRMTVVSRFSSLEHLEQIVEMGAIEGLSQAVGQIDDLLKG